MRTFASIAVGALRDVEEGFSVISTPATQIRFNRLLLTGAAGNLGKQLRPRLRVYCNKLRVSDIASLDPATGNEEVMSAPLQDASAVRDLLEGVDAVVHMGGVSIERPWEPILQGNIMGVVNVYEAARLHGVKRIVLASSNHVTGFYKQNETVDVSMPVRPDGLYGLSKAFAEDCAQMYWDRWGIETVSLRIGSSFPEPLDRRMLATWLSYDDLERLVAAALSAPAVGHTIIYGMSDNQHVFWDNRHAKHIGYRPRDSSDSFRAGVEARQQRIDTKSAAATFQGGIFVTQWENDSKN